MPEVRMEGVEIVKKPEREDVHYNSENEGQKIIMQVENLSRPISMAKSLSTPFGRPLI